MTKKQIECLKLLGYVDSQEEGALLEHPSFLHDDCYVWKDNTFEGVLQLHNIRHRRAVCKWAASRIYIS